MVYGYGFTLLLLFYYGFIYGSPFPYFHRTVPEFYITLPCVIRKPPAWFWFALSDWPSFLFTPLFPVFRWSVLFLFFLVSPMAWIASSVVRVHLINEDKLPWKLFQTEFFLWEYKPLVIGKAKEKEKKSEQIPEMESPDCQTKREAIFPSS